MNPTRRLLLTMMATAGSLDEFFLAHKALENLERLVVEHSQLRGPAPTPLRPAPQPTMPAQWQQEQIPQPSRPFAGSEPPDEDFGTLSWEDF